MIQKILNSRNFVACLLAAATGMALYFRVPFPDENIFLQVMALRSASIFPIWKASAELFQSISTLGAFLIAKKMR